MNNLSSYCGLVDAKIRASDKELPVRTNQYAGFSKSSYCLASQVCLKCGVADPHFFTYKIFDRPN